MDDPPLLLKPPPRRDHRSRHDLTPVECEPVWPEDNVGDSGVVFDRYEQDALRGARTLAHKDHAGHFDVSAIADVREIDAANDSHRVELVAQEAPRMCAERELSRALIFDYLASLCHGSQPGLGLEPLDRTRVVMGTRVYVRVDIGGRRQ